MSITSRELDGSFAREILDVQLWKELDVPQVEAIRAIWAECGVIVFRRQALSEDELARFSAQFGRPERIARTDWASPNRPDITVISNLRDDAGKSIGGLGQGELAWHTDQCYVAEPATGAMLYALELPSAGGVTSWANLNRAYEALPDFIAARCRRQDSHLQLRQASGRLQTRPISAISDDIRAQDAQTSRTRWSTPTR